MPKGIVQVLSREKNEAGEIFMKKEVTRRNTVTA